VNRTAWDGVFRSGRDLYTRNAEPGVKVYGEALRREDEFEYRLWDPWRSKLAAFVLRTPDLPELPSPVRSILYLGGAHGTTVSHLAEIFPNATLFVIEKSPTSFSHLLALGKRRENVLPILADAQLPERYAADVGTVEFLYQDVAQRAQAGIFAENAAACLTANGRGLLMVKVRSVTQTRPSRSVIRSAQEELSSAGLRVTWSTELTPFSRDHVGLWIEPA
jgi:fibrillarin-like pre-rRNA processing protein